MGEIIAQILITGAAGVLGGATAREGLRVGASIRGLGRGPRPAKFQSEWFQVDLLTGEGLPDALDGVRTIIHCATNPRNPQDDLRALDCLIDACRSRQIHLSYVSIAGIEEAIELSPYFRAKRDCENKIVASGCRYSIVRATQFHPFLESLIRQLTFGPVLLEPALIFAPVDPLFVGQMLLAQSLNQTRGYIAEVNGPERLTLNALVSERLRITGSAKNIRLQIPAFGPLAAFKKMRAVEGHSGGRTWREWLEERSRDDVAAAT